jgi:hypothetical protein
VGAVPEGEVAVVGTFDVETIGVGNPARVARLAAFIQA